MKRILSERRISSPETLTAMLRDLKECLVQGELYQVRPLSTPFGIDDLDRIPNDGPWPDFIEAYFDDQNGQRYKLSVETYHGAGGSWEKV